jgi:hypothetical protein
MTVRDCGRPPDVLVVKPMDWERTKDGIGQPDGQKTGGKKGVGCNLALQPTSFLGDVHVAHNPVRESSTDHVDALHAAGTVWLRQGKTTRRPKSAQTWQNGQDAQGGVFVYSPVGARAES